MRFTAKQWFLVLALLTATVASSYRAAQHLEPLVSRQAATQGFYDLRLWRNAVSSRLDRTGELYETSRPDFFAPGSHVKYKYPPFYGGLLRLGRNTPRFAQRLAQAILTTELLVLAFLIWDFRPVHWLRVWLAGLAVVSWQPLLEAWADMSMEGVLLPLFVLALVALRHRRTGIWGVLVGIATGIKVYPVALLALPALRLQRRALAGFAAGTLATLILGAILIPWKHTVIFLRDVLPHIGGASLNMESVGLLSSYSRLGLFLAGDLPAVADIELQTLASEAGPWVRALAQGSWIATILAASIIVWRHHRDSPRWFPMAICILVAWIPTSWCSYQALLLLPWLVLLLELPATLRPTFPWISALLVAACGLVNAYDGLYSQLPVLAFTCRALIPVLLFVALHRIGPSVRSSPAAANA